MNGYKIAFGITSQCQDNSHIFISDIDEEISIQAIKRISLRLQHDYKLSTIYIIGSKHGYNLISLDKLPCKMVYMINHSIDEVDPVFNRLAFKERGFYVIRTQPNYDKMVIDLAYSKNNIFVRSNAHRIFFNSLFDLNIEKTDIFDESERVTMCRFKNKKYGWTEHESE
jgi:hypothetical protein